MVRERSWRVSRSEVILQGLEIAYGAMDLRTIETKIVADSGYKGSFEDYIDYLLYQQKKTLPEIQETLGVDRFTLGRILFKYCVNFLP
jgi:hypothetical protein